MIRVCAPFGEMKSILMAFSSKSQSDYQMVHMHNYYVECLACNHNVFLWVMNLSIILNIVFLLIQWLIHCIYLIFTNVSSMRVMVSQK